jgi:pimeloyl-ACP methyl ester carboxylesterase
MTPLRQVAVVGAVLALVSGCGLLGGSEAVPSTRPSAEASPQDGATSAPAASTEPSPEPSVDLSRFYEQEVQWRNCGAADCATILAPLDYTDPEGPTIELGITRLPATGERIGSLFVNPGGPGGSAVEYAKAGDFVVSGDVREAYDIVGVDPRGVGTSEPVECLTDAQLDAFGAVDGTPDSADEEQLVADLAAQVGEGCARDSAPRFAHVGTVDSARDLDIARALVGDETLTYLGKSYGTMLGATYAELFPDRVGRVVLDGVLPASLDLVEVTRGQAEEFEEMLRDFVRDCQEYDDCPLTGGVDDGVRQVQEWLESLDESPLPGRAGEERDLNEALAAYAVLSNLYFPSYDYPRLREALAAAIDRGDPTQMFDILDSRISRGPDGRYLDNSTEAFYSVTCLDRPYDGGIDEVRALAEEWRETAPTFGPALAWGLLACTDWPATGEQITSTVAAGSNPILVVSTRLDPATPYEWGVLLADELENGHLVTYEGVGHTAYREGSACVDDAVDRYLLRGEVPEAGLSCS